MLITGARLVTPNSQLVDKTDALRSRRAPVGDGGQLRIIRLYSDLEAFSRNITRAKVAALPCQSAAVSNYAA